MSLFDLGVATIFAREFLEGGIIVGNYRTVINKSDEIEQEDKNRKLNAVSVAAAGASFVAVLMILIVGIPLGIASKNFDNRVAEIIEGVSKIVAAIAILGLSLKIPVWLGVYEKVPMLPWKRNKVKTDKKEELLSVREIRFNVAWNIWREVAECGVFLLPYFLQREGIKSIPLSALAGIAIALVITLGFFYANSRLENKAIIAIVMCTLTLLLAIGLFSGGCHEFEEVLCLPDSTEVVEGAGVEGAAVEGATALEGDVVEGDTTATDADGDAIFEGGPVAPEAEAGAEEVVEAGTEGRRLHSAAEGASSGENYCTPVIYRIPGKFWDQSRFPMALFKPFGYSHKPTVLQTAAWWSWFALAAALHYYKWHLTREARAKRELSEEGESGEKRDVESGQKGDGW